MQTYHSFLYLFLAAVLLAAAGCGKSWHGGEPLYPVTITVSKGGEPFSGASVTLLREGGIQIINAGGVTDSGGIAKLVAVHGIFFNLPKIGLLSTGSKEYS